MAVYRNYRNWSDPFTVRNKTELYWDQYDFLNFDFME